MSRRVDLRELFLLLEMPEALAELQGAGSFEEAGRILAGIKRRAVAQRRRLAKKYHPDIPGNDPEHYKDVTGAEHLVQKLVVQRPQPVVIRFTYTSASTSAGTSTSGSFWGW